MTRTAPETLPPDHVAPRPALLDALGDSRDSVVWLGHACFALRVNGVRVITDPFLAAHASPLPPFGPERYAGPAVETTGLPPFDVVLLSHNHYDHLDRPTLERLPLAPRATLVCPLRVAEYVDRSRFARVVELDWHETTDLGAIAVTALPAIHFSARSLFDRNYSLWSGFLLSGPRHRIYFAGDTAFGPIFAETGRSVGAVDLALVPIGAYAPRPLMQAAHCDPEEAVAIARAFGARRIGAMHWGTIQLTDEHPFEPPERFGRALAEAGLAEAGWVPPIGGGLPL